MGRPAREYRGIAHLQRHLRRGIIRLEIFSWLDIRPETAERGPYVKRNGAARREPLMGVAGRERLP
jgi:hypothetical protein